MDANATNKSLLLVTHRLVIGVRRHVTVSAKKDGALKDTSRIRKLAFASAHLKNAQKELFGTLKNVSVIKNYAENLSSVLLSNLGILFNVNVFALHQDLSAKLDTSMMKKPVAVNLWKFVHTLFLNHILFHTLFQNQSSGPTLFLTFTPASIQITTALTLE